MTILELARLGKDMRAAQHTYFNPRTRTDAALNHSKELERAFDAAVKAVLGGQMTMFGEPR